MMRGFPPSRIPPRLASSVVSVPLIVSVEQLYVLYVYEVDVFITSITIISTALLSLLSFSVDETKCAFGSKEVT